MDEASIERLAEEELLQEAKRGAARASVDGPTGWQKCPLPKTNKRFLHNTILHSMQSNRASRHASDRPRERRREPSYKRSSSDGRKKSRSGDKTPGVEKQSDKRVPDGGGSEKKPNIVIEDGSSRNDEPVK